MLIFVNCIRNLPFASDRDPTEARLWELWCWSCEDGLGSGVAESPGETGMWWLPEPSSEQGRWLKVRAAGQGWGCRKKARWGWEIHWEMGHFLSTGSFLSLYQHAGASCPVHAFNPCYVCILDSSYCLYQTFLYCLTIKYNTDLLPQNSNAPKYGALRKHSILPQWHFWEWLHPLWPLLSVTELAVAPGSPRWPSGGAPVTLSPLLVC